MDKIQELVKSRGIDNATVSYEKICADLQQLQAEQPKQETDIDAIVREIENDKYKKYHNRSLSQDEGVYNQALNMAIHIISKHLTQKTTVPKDGEVEISNNLEAWYKTDCPSCGYDEIHTISNYCGGCGAKIKRC